MTYEVYATERFLEELSKYPSSMQDKINRKLSDLRKNPYLGAHWKKEVFRNKYKVEIENLRIIYEIDKRSKRIYLVYLQKIFSPTVYRNPFHPTESR